MNNMAGAI